MPDNPPLPVTVASDCGPARSRQRNRMESVMSDESQSPIFDVPTADAIAEMEQHIRDRMCRQLHGFRLLAGPSVLSCGAAREKCVDNHPVGPRGANLVVSPCLQPN